MVKICIVVKLQRLRWRHSMAVLVEMASDVRKISPYVTGCRTVIEILRFYFYQRDLLFHFLYSQNAMIYFPDGTRIFGVRGPLGFVRIVLLHGLTRLESCLLVFGEGVVHIT